MTIRADLLLDGIGDLATMSAGLPPLAGDRAGALARVENAAVAVSEGRFVFVGRSREARREVRLRRGGRSVDLAGASVVPGFVDAHTHLVFAGDRAGELAWKIGGMGYAEIARRGGGLYSTVRATRRAPSA
ncbi:MAG TPA: imidazolonepropionase, partial [Thermoplasmata archaeon]|nr:imidazolonepropionase [Thermoplasmata archaeon]